MKKTQLFLTGAFILLASLLFAQRSPEDPRHENHYFASPLEISDLIIEFINTHSQKEFIQVKLKITNKTSDFILFKPSECVFRFMDGKEFSDKKRNVVIAPGSTETTLLKVTGGYNFHVEKLSFIPKGFYKVKIGKEIQVQDFKLPAETNTFETDKMTCRLDKQVKETKETVAVFKCTNTASIPIIVNSSRLSVKTKGGQKFANDYRKDADRLVQPAETEKIVAEFHIPAQTADMQTAILFIEWNNTFKEGNISAVPLSPVTFTLDPVLTELKNK